MIRAKNLFLWQILTVFLMIQIFVVVSLIIGNAFSWSITALALAVLLGALTNLSIISSITQISKSTQSISQDQRELKTQIQKIAAVTESIVLIAKQLETFTQDNKRLRAKYRQLERDTVNLQQANHKLYHLANIDSLTQIYNRYHFDLALQQLWQIALQQQSSISIILGDVDNFKLYNDTYGHLMGDKCLAEVAQAIKRGANRQQDVVARYGGEEFAVILVNTDASGIAAVAQKIVNYTHQLNIVHSASLVSDRVTISCGASIMIPSPDNSPVQLLQLADEALYRAKREGKNRYVLAANKIT